MYIFFQRYSYLYTIIITKILETDSFLSARDADERFNRGISILTAVE